MGVHSDSSSMDPYLTKDISISSSEGKWTISIPFSTMRDCSLFTMEAIVSSGFNTMSVASNPFSGKVSFTEMGMVEGGDRFSVRYLMVCVCVCICVCTYVCGHVHIKVTCNTQDLHTLQTHTYIHRLHNYLIVHHTHNTHTHTTHMHTQHTYTHNTHAHTTHIHTQHTHTQHTHNTHTPTHICTRTHTQHTYHKHQPTFFPHVPAHLAVSSSSPPTAPPQPPFEPYGLGTRGGKNGIIAVM